ncbi:MAG: nitrous oxide reductase accessory protein NosL [Nitrospirae bacterium]|nr:nitrous oxide reductase accessory protein NosL [Magnetococcales bacterium]
MIFRHRYGWVGILGVVLWMTACEKLPDTLPPPKEPAPGTMGYYCGMTLEEHPGPKGQIWVTGEKNALWFSSVADAFSYLKLEGITRPVAAFYVHDMGRADWDQPQPGTWIRAESAFFSVGGRRTGGMGATEIVPFATQDQADIFSRQYGGRVKNYQEVIENY